MPRRLPRRSELPDPSPRRPCARLEGPAQGLAAGSSPAAGAANPVDRRTRVDRAVGRRRRPHVASSWAPGIPAAMTA